MEKQIIGHGQSREFKFRCWHNINRYMVITEIAIGNIIKKHITGYPGPNDLLGGNGKTEPTDYTIMQYTGLKDKNGVDIYEGDILGYYRTTDGLKKQGVVEFDINVGAWYCGGNLLSSVLHEQNNDERKLGCGYLVQEKQYAIVTGNIYQNADLLSE